MKRFSTASFLFFALAACSDAVQRTPTVVPSLEASPSVLSTQTSQTILSTVPSDMVEPENLLAPHGTPFEEWRGIPILPEATAGQEFREDNAYSFKADVTAKEVQDLYTATLTELGWSQPFDAPFDANGGRMTFRKESSSLAIIVTSSGNSVIVVLVMTLS